MPTIPFRVAVRAQSGKAMVIESYPIRPDGYPNPDWFWLVDRDLVRKVGTVESLGGVVHAENHFKGSLEAIHNSYRAARNSLIKQCGVDIHIEGGVGGARKGVKCLHSHLAYYLAGGYSPVGEWTSLQV